MDYYMIPKDQRDAWVFCRNLVGRPIQELNEALEQHFGDSPLIDMEKTIPPDELAKNVNFVVVVEGIIAEAREVPPSDYVF